MFQNAYKAKFDAMPPDPEFRRQLEERIEEMKAPHMNKRKLPAAAAAVVIALLVLTTGALAASGTLGSVFLKFMTFDPFYTFAAEGIDLVKLSEIIDWEPQTQTVTFSNGLTADVTLKEAFYDGEQILLGWMMNNDPDQIAFIDKEALPSTKNASPSNDYIPSFMSKTDQEAFERRFAKDGFACAAYTIPELDDENFFIMGTGLSMLDFAEFDVNDKRGVVDCIPLGAGQATRWKEKNTAYMMDIDQQMPEVVLEHIADMDPLPLTKYIRGTMYYYFRDETGSYFLNAGDEWHTITFDVPRTSIETETTNFTVELSNHTADVTLTRSELQLIVEVESHISDEDIAMLQEYRKTSPNERPDALEKDVLMYYELYINGERTGVFVDQQWNYYSKFHVVVPEGCNQMTIRPAYFNSGEHPEEDITIDLATMTIVE